MDAPLPRSTISIKDQINNDMLKVYKEILIKHLDERVLKEDKVYSWMNNILREAKEYFIKKYPDYDLFLYNYICPKNVYFRSNGTSISFKNTDYCNSVDFNTDYLHSVLYFFYYKHINLNYTLDECENEIIQKGNEILGKYLDGKKFNYVKLPNYNNSTNEEHIDFKIKKKNSLICFFLTEIYKNPIQNKYFFKYLSYGKEIYMKIFQTYVNDSLMPCHNVFFFK